MHRSIAVLASIFAAAFAAGSAVAADATAQVFQQRTADGRILLTDRPLEGARTERTWRVEKEDPVAARARSDRVQREAEAVAARVDRRLARDEWRLREDDRRMAALREEANEQPALDGQVLLYPDGGYYGRYGGFYGRGDRHSRYDRAVHQGPFDPRTPHHRDSRSTHGPLLRLHLPQAPRPLLTPPF